MPPISGALTAPKKPASFADVLDMFLVKKNGQKNVFSDNEQQVDNLFNRENNDSNGREE